VKLDGICRSNNCQLIVARSYGLMGLVRISAPVRHSHLAVLPLNPSDFKLFWSHQASWASSASAPRCVVSAESPFVCSQSVFNSMRQTPMRCAIEWI